MKKLLIFILLFILVGCSEAYAELEMSNQEKKIMLGMMKDPDFSKFHLTGDINVTIDNQFYNLKIDSYNNISEYSYSNILINENHVNVFYKENQLYIESEIDIDVNLLNTFTLSNEFIEQISFDSDDALDALSIHSFLLGHKFKYHFTEKHFNDLNKNSFLDISLNYSGNILESIELNTELGFKDLFIEGNLYIELKDSNPELPDLSSYELIDYPF